MYIVVMDTYAIGFILDSPLLRNIKTNCQSRFTMLN